MGKQSITNDKLDNIIRETKFDSPENANASLSKHGLSTKMNPDDHSAEIYDGSNRVASVQFDGDDYQRIENISY